MKKRILALAAVAALALSVFALGACSNQEDNSGEPQTADNAAAAAADNVLVVGFDPGQPPMGYTDESGNYVGFDIDLATEVASRLGMELKLQPINWDAKQMEVESGNIDCIWNGFTIEGRENDYTWSNPYMQNEQVFVVRAGSDIKTKEDLAGKTLAYQKDSSASAALEKNPEFMATLGNSTQTDTNLNALLEVQTGSVDAALLDSTMAEYNITRQGGQYEILEEPLSAENYGIGYKLGNTELRDKVQGALDAMVADGTFATISNEWFGRDVSIKA